MNQWIDFRELRSRLRFQDVLRLYRVELTQKGHQLVGRCPLPNHPKDDRSPSFSANAERGIFQCFRCKARGNLLDFAGLMEGIDLRNGAELRRVAVTLMDSLSQGDQQTPSVSQHRTAQSQPAEKRVLVNEPLDFELKGLDAKHPWLLKSGLSPETIAYFGLGVAQRGYLNGRLAIPLHNLDGKLVGYAGRILDDSQITPDNPKYLFPETRERNGVIHRFDPYQIVYNAHRIRGHSDGFAVADMVEHVWRFHELGMAAAVGLFGGECSPAQAREILRHRENENQIAYISANPPADGFWRNVGRSLAIRWIEASAEKTVMERRQ